MPAKRRLMIMTEGQLDVVRAKTAVSLMRYCPDDVVCVLDSAAAAAGTNLQREIGVGAGIPVVRDVAGGLRHRPTQLLIGIAPVGGRLPDSWRATILAAIDAGLDIVSGLHHLLNGDAEFLARATARGVRLWDVRVPPEDLGVAEDRLRDLRQRRVALVGADCCLGKMVTSLEVDRGLRALGYDSEFVATGQTGIMIAGSGIAVDHVLSDYVNGAAERLCWERRHRQIVVVEGQGSVYHPAYSGVTVGLLHGCLPHAIIYQHSPTRARIHEYEHWPTMPVADGIALVEHLMRPLQPAKVVAVGLNTFGMSAADAARAAREIEERTGLPAADPIRDGADKLVKAVVASLALSPAKQGAAR